MVPHEYSGDTIPVHCDMASFGGGWNMCYSESTSGVDVFKDVGYWNNKMYGASGYRSNCTGVFFNEVMFVISSTDGWGRSGQTLLTAQVNDVQSWHCGPC